MLDTLITHDAIDKNLDEYTNEIYKLEQWARDNNDEELACFFDIALIKHIDYILDEEAVKHYERLAEKEQRNGHPGTAALAYSMMSGKYRGKKQYTRSFVYGLQAYELYKNLDLEVYPARISQQTYLANGYYTFGDDAKAKYYLNDLVKASKNIANIPEGHRVLNTLGLIYLNEKHYDSAREIFTSLYNTQKHNQRYALMAIAAGNIGDSYLREHNIDSAEYWMLKEADIVEKYIPGKLKRNIANSASALAIIYYDKGEYDKALQFINKGLEQVKAMRGPDYRILKELYAIYARVEAAQGKYVNAYNYVDSYARMSDSVSVQYSKDRVLAAEQKIDSINYEIRFIELEHARKTSILVRNASIVLILLTSVIVILIINRRRLKAKQKQEKADIELGNARKQLSQYTRNLQEKNQRIEQVTSEIEKLKDEQNERTVNETLLQLQQSTILTDEEWDEFRILFEQVHSGFINRLKDKYPDITPAETRYLVLAKLNLNNKEMANILGIGANAIRNNKFRLRKKFDLPDDESFDNMINNI